MLFIKSNALETQLTFKSIVKYLSKNINIDQINFKILYKCTTNSYVQ